MKCLACENEVVQSAGRGGRKKYCSRTCISRFWMRKMQQEHPDKVRAWRRDFRKNNFKSVRNSEYKKRYGITLEQYNAMFLDQNGCCSICHRHQSDMNSKLHVDHCHKTKRVRGLLCSHCNRGLGHFGDNSTYLSSAVAYVNRSKLEVIKNG